MFTLFNPIHVQTLGYVPVVHRHHQNKKKEKEKVHEFQEFDIKKPEIETITSKYKYKKEGDENKSKNDNDNKIMSMKDFKSLILTALVFLTIFAWVDVLAAFYKSYYYEYRLKHNNYPILKAGSPAFVHTVDIVHKLPKSKLPRDNLQEMDAKMKAGYAIILTLVTGIVWIILDK